MRGTNPRRQWDRTEIYGRLFDALKRQIVAMKGQAAAQGREHRALMKRVRLLEGRRVS